MILKVFNNVAKCESIEIFSNLNSVNFEITGAMPLCDFLRITYKNAEDMKTLKINGKKFIINDLKCGTLDLLIECVCGGETIKTIYCDKIKVADKCGQFELIPQVEDLKNQITEIQNQVENLRNLIIELYQLEIKE